MELRQTLAAYRKKLVKYMQDLICVTIRKVDKIY